MCGFFRDVLLLIFLSIAVPGTLAQACGVSVTVTCSESCQCTLSTSIWSDIISGGPGNYPNSTDCYWTINSNVAISLWFTEFNTAGRRLFVSSYFPDYSMFICFDYAFVVCSRTYDGKRNHESDHSMEDYHYEFHHAT